MYLYLLGNISPLFSFLFGKMTDILKEEYTKIIRGIPQIYNVHENIKQQMAIGSHKAEHLDLTRLVRDTNTTS
jgi:hypothetical protein